jgi:hypothetical protein
MLSSAASNCCTAIRVSSGTGIDENSTPAILSNPKNGIDGFVAKPSSGGIGIDL